MRGSISVLRIFFAVLAIVGVCWSVADHVYHQEFSSFFELFAQFTYVCNVIVAIFLILIAFGKIDEKNIIIPLPSIVLTYIVFSLFLSDGITKEAYYSVIEHYVIAIYLMFDFVFFVKDKNKFKSSLIFAVMIVVIYLSYVFMYGYLSAGYYPYFFFDLKTHSLSSVIWAVAYINMLLVVIFMLFFGFKYLQVRLRQKLIDIIRIYIIWILDELCWFTKL